MSSKIRAQVTRNKDSNKRETELRTFDLDEEARELIFKEKKEELEKLKKTWPLELKLRRHFAYILVILVGVSTVASLTILFFLGFKVCGFHLSDTVVIAIISATVAELASLFYIILRYLFPQPPES